MGVLVRQHLDDRQGLNGSLSILSIQNIKDGTGYIETRSGSQECREFLLDSLTKLLKLFLTLLILDVVRKNCLDNRMPSKTFINQLRHNTLQFVNDALLKVRFQLQELLQRDFSLVSSTITNVVLQQEEVIAVQSNDHLDSLQVVQLSVDVLNDFTSKLMHNQFLDLTGNLLS